MGKTVLADPQFGVVRILRPYADFEDNYGAAVPATTPIMLSEGGIALDEAAAAGETGYDPRLVRGLEVPAGARILIWTPSLYSTPRIGEDYPYIYTLVWRYRSVFDFGRRRKPYHLPVAGQGIAESIPPNQGSRVILPAANQSVIYNQTEAGVPGTPAIQTQRLHTENVQYEGLPLTNPINPDGQAGALQQGVQIPSGGNEHTRPLYSLHEVQAAGDELLIEVTRGDNNGATPNWDFANDDEDFSVYYGKAGEPAGGPFPDLGVYVNVGVSP